MRPPDAYGDALARALLKVFPNPSGETITPEEVAQRLAFSTPVAPRLRGEGAVTLHVPRCDWPLVHNTIRAHRIPVETHKDSPPRHIALSTTAAHARALTRAHPSVKVAS